MGVERSPRLLSLLSQFGQVHREAEGGVLGVWGAPGG